MAMGPGGKGVKSDINVTPLVDVVLVLLIIFMVIGPMLQKGKSVQLPEAKNVAEPKGGGDPILISVTKDGKAWLNKKKVPLEELSDRLVAEMDKPGTGGGIVLKGDRDAEYKS